MDLNLGIPAKFLWWLAQNLHKIGPINALARAKMEEYLKGTSWHGDDCSVAFTVGTMDNGIFQAIRGFQNS